MIFKVRPLKGYRSLRAFNAFHALILGGKMLPAYLGESYESFLARVQDMPPEDRRKVLREFACFVELQKDELEAILEFCEDSNGVPFRAENMKNLGPSELVDAIVAVCMAIGEIKIDLISETEKKN